MNPLLQRAAPGLALATVTLGAVWWADPALNRSVEDTAAPLAEGVSAPDDASARTSDPGAPDSGTSEAPRQAQGCESATTGTGDPAYTQWGPVQVELAVAPDGTICTARAVAYPDGDRRSMMINSSAIPHLDARAASEGIAFDAISGATYTSEAYRQSMQSILDRL
jgi:uncharacterized protein with FMN-binding domain